MLLRFKTGNKMNRKAKLAYAYMAIGLVLFIAGSLIIVDRNLNNNEEMENEHTSEIDKNTFNRSEFLLIAFRSKSLSITTHDFDYENTYWVLLCEIKHKYNLNNELKIIKPIFLLDNNLIYSRPVGSSYFRKFFIFLICKSDKVYLTTIILSAAFGFVLLCFGCFGFYKYDIKLIQELNNERLKLNSSLLTNKYIETLNKNKICVDLAAINTAKNGFLSKREVKENFSKRDEKNVNRWNRIQLKKLRSKINQTP